MPYGRVAGTVVGLFDAVFRPASFVAASGVGEGGSLVRTAELSASLVGVYVVNLVLYAGPLTLAGYGVPETGQPPVWFGPVAGRLLGDPATAWALANGFVQNSAFLTVLSGLTLAAYHVALVVTRNSRGFLMTLHTVVYSVSAYLAGIFTVLVFLSGNAGYTTARDLVVQIQVRFLTLFYDAFGVPVSSRLFRPGESVAVAGLSGAETFVLAVLVLLMLYFVYSLYLGTRLNHGASFGGAVLAIVAVALSPAAYVSALIVYSTGGLV